MVSMCSLVSVTYNFFFLFLKVYVCSRSLLANMREEKKLLVLNTTKVKMTKKNLVQG